MGELAKTLKELSQEVNIDKVSTSWLVDNVKSMKSKKNINNNDMTKVQLKDLQNGKFYFMFYDMQSKFKTTKMEQYSPILLINHGKIKGKPIMLGLNLNFIPNSVKFKLFDKMIDRFFKSTFNKNKDIEEIKDQSPFNLTYEGIYNILENMSMEYAIREYRMDYINEIYELNMNNVTEFIITNTEVFTNVDERKLLEIWVSKMKNQSNRRKTILENIITNTKLLDAEMNDIINNSPLT